MAWAFEKRGRGLCMKEGDGNAREEEREAKDGAVGHCESRSQSEGTVRAVAWWRISS